MSVWVWKPGSARICRVSQFVYRSNKNILFLNKNHYDVSRTSLKYFSNSFLVVTYEKIISRLYLHCKEFWMGNDEALYTMLKVHEKQINVLSSERESLKNRILVKSDTITIHFTPRNLFYTTFLQQYNTTLYMCTCGTDVLYIIESFNLKRRKYNSFGDPKAIYTYKCAMYYMSTRIMRVGLSCYTIRRLTFQWKKNKHLYNNGLYFFADTHAWRCVHSSRRKRHRTLECVWSSLYTYPCIIIYKYRYLYSRYTFSICLRPLLRHFVISTINWPRVRQYTGIAGWPIDGVLVFFFFLLDAPSDRLYYAGRRREAYLKVSGWPAKKNVKGQL